MNRPDDSINLGRICQDHACRRKSDPGGPSAADLAMDDDQHRAAVAHAAWVLKLIRRQPGITTAGIFKESAAPIHLDRAALRMLLRHGAACRHPAGGTALWFSIHRPAAVENSCISVSPMHK